jgi:hypothetical protein
VRRGLLHYDCRDTTQAVAVVGVTVSPELFGSCDFDFGSRSAPFEGAATHKASGSAGGYLLEQGSERPAAVKGAPLSGAAPRTLDGEGRSERMAGGGKG